MAFFIAYINMRHFYSPLVVLTILCSCSPTNQTKSKDLDYADFLDRHVLYNEIFIKEEESYLVYFYSEYCGYCQSIKEDILTFASEEYFPLYFCNDIDNFVLYGSVETTIGCDDVSCLAICGTPSLMRIESHKVMENICGRSSVLAYLSFYIDK